MNIYQILEALKRVEEASWINGKEEDPKSLRWKQTSMSYEEAVAKYGADHVRKEGKARDGHEVIAVLVPLGPVEEGEFTFANPKQKPGDQVRGTEKAVAKKSGAHPFAGRLVGASESAMQEWKRVVAELAPPVGQVGTVGTQGQTPQDKAKQISTATQGINKLKGAGVAIANPSQAVKSMLKDPTDPTTPMTPQDKQLHQTIGQDVEQAIQDPNKANQIAAILKQTNTKAGVR